MQRWLSPLLAATAASALTVFVAVAVGQETPALIRGGGSAGVVRDAYGYTNLKGQSRRADFDRNVLKVPGRFGQAFAVTPVGRNGTAVWYRAQDGTVHNVILQNDQTLVTIQLEADRD